MSIKCYRIDLQVQNLSVGKSSISLFTPKDAPILGESSHSVTVWQILITINQYPKCPKSVGFSHF